MRAFFIELARAALVAWGKAWRVIIRKKRNFFIFLGAVLVILIVGSGVLEVASPQKKAAPAATAAPTARPTVPYTAVTAKPINEPAPTPTATGSYSVDGGGPQAPTGNAAPTLPSREPVTIPAPVQPTVDPANQESVAKGFATAYLSRPSGEWGDWQEWISGYTTPALLTQLETLAFHDKSPLTGKEPTQVTDVKILPADEGEAVDTPIRWSRNLEVAVQSADGMTTLITYAVTLSKGENGWVVSKAVEQFWTVQK